MRSSLAISAERAHGLDDVGGGAVALAAPTSRQPQLGVGAAHPVDRVSTISAVSSSRSATTSRITVRTMRFLSRASVVGADQTALRSSARVSKEIGARSRPRRGRVVLGDRFASTSATRESARFQRASSSPATRRFSGSAASYCRKARSAA